MKLFNQETQKNIVCSVCGGNEFFDSEFLPTRYSTYEVICEKDGCNMNGRKSNLLIPVKDIKKIQKL